MSASAPDRFPEGVGDAERSPAAKTAMETPVEERLSTEFALTLLRAERMRATLIASFFAGLALLLVVRLVLPFGQEGPVPLSPAFIGVRLAVVLALMGLQLLVRHLLARRLATATPLPEGAWYLLAVAEIGALGATSYVARSSAPLSAAVGFEVQVTILLLFVGLSALRLRVGLSVLTGLLAAAIYLKVAWTLSPTTLGQPVDGFPEGHYWVAALVAASGGIAGALAWQLRRQGVRLIQSLADRELLERQAAHAADAERHRIGRDLHDDLGSRLTGIAMLCRGLVHRAQKGRPIEVDRLAEVATEVEASVEQARRLARGLSPPDLTGGHLLPALQGLADRTEAATGLPTAVQAPEPTAARLSAMAPDLTEHLYRIAQEAVANAVKHAAATEITLTLDMTEHGLRLAVSDNGRGCTEAERQRPERLGLHTMRRRARLIGAAFRLESSPAGGTRVECVVPMD
ncbi:MAG: sensor histidine kinase [Bacteroidota bacterium]